jgi:DNA-binding NarL/FixJ family response regulator
MSPPPRTPPTRATTRVVSGAPRTILIVDDHKAFRESVSVLLESEEFTVVGTVADGAAALVAETRLRPAIVLLDIELGDESGFAVAVRLSELPDPPRVVLTSSRPADAYGPLIEAARARGFGFLAKRALSCAALAALVS